MKWFKLTIAAAAAVAVSVQAQVEKPVVMDEAMISVSIPNVHGFIDEFGVMASQASPMVNGPMIKSMIGMQLGDMNLMGIPANGGLSVVALDPTNIFAVVEVSEAQSSAYVNMAQAKGLAAAYSDGAVIAAKDVGVLSKVGGKAAAVRSTLLAGNAPVISIAMQPAAMIARNRASIDGFMAMMPAMLGMGMMKQPGATLESTQSITQILQAELMVLLSLSEQCREAEVKIAPKGGSLILSETFVPKAGTPLADLVNAPAEYKENAKLHAGLLGGGAVKVDKLHANPKALAKLISAETVKTVRGLMLEGVDPEETAAVMTRWSKIYAGSDCTVVSMSDGEFSVRSVMEISDETKALEALRSANKDLAPFLKMTKGMDSAMTMTLKENVREADGISIHHLNIRVDAPSMSAEEQKKVKAMGLDNMVIELAITDGMLFCAEEGAVDALIKKVKAGEDAPKIAARSTYPAGGFYYLDIDMGEYMSFVGTAAGEPQLGAMFADTPPITSAGFKKDGMVNWSLTVPSGLIAKYGQVLMMQQMQSMQMGAPGAAPVVPVQ